MKQRKRNGRWQMGGKFELWVPCDHAPKGRHPVTIVWDTESIVRYLDTGCGKNPAADAEERLGGYTCTPLLQEVHNELLSDQRSRHENAAFRGVIEPLGEKAQEVREEREDFRMSLDENVLNHITEWIDARCGLPLVEARMETDGVFLVHEWRGERMANRVDGRWNFYPDVVLKIATDIGVWFSFPEESYAQDCNLCRKTIKRNFKRHCESKRHKQKFYDRLAALNRWSKVKGGT